MFNNEILYTMTKDKFIGFWLFLALGMATVLFNSCDKDDDPDNGVRINGIIWAKYNVASPGIFAANPEDAGMFYQWNRKVGWSVIDPMVNSNEDTMWDNDIPAGTMWEKSNDPSPAGWRVPTLNEIKRLFDTKKVTNEWTTVSDIAGRKFTDKATGNSIFLPAVGYRRSRDGTLNGDGLLGNYWSSIQDGDDDAYAYAYALCFDSILAGGWGSTDRGKGFSVRPVADN